MLNSIGNNKWSIGGLAVIVAIGAWYFMGGDAPQEQALVTESFTTPESEADRDLVATLLQLRNVKLDGTIFNDPVFQMLRDFGSDIVPEPVGRPNPFAPLDAQAAAVGEARGATTTGPRR